MMFDLAVIGLAVVFIAIGLMHSGRRQPPSRGSHTSASTNGTPPAKKKSKRMVDTWEER